MRLLFYAYDISCVVGHEIQFVFDETEKKLLRISGILNTGFQEENYKHFFMNQDGDEYREENLDYNYLTQYSYSNLCYINRKIYSHLFELWDSFEYHEFWLIGKLPTSKKGLKYLAKLDYNRESSKTPIANSYIDEVDTLINERWLTWFHLYVAGIFLTVLTCILSIVFFYHYFCYAGAGWKYLKYNKYSLCKTYSYPFALAGLLMLASLLIGIPLGISILEIINCFSSKPYYAFGITGVLWALLASTSIYLFSMIVALILSDNKLISK